MFTRFLYANYRLLSTLRWRMGRRFTKGGVLTVAGLGASAVLGAHISLTMAYQAFTFLLSLLAISLLCSAFFRPRLTVRRILPRFGTVGQPLPYRLQVRNAGPKTLRGLVLLDDLADPRPSLHAFVRAREPGEERRNWFDRALGYYRYRWLVSQNEVTVGGEQSLPALPPGGEVELRRDLTPARRGRVGFTGVTAARLDPFGLSNALTTLPLGQSLLILPRRYPLPALQLPGSRADQHGRVTLASQVGDSEEFVALREYRPGDPLRRIHWKSWARTGKPIVKEYQEEFFVRHALVLDTFLSAEDGEVFEDAVSVAASFACTVLTQESLLDLLFVGPQAYCVTAGRGVGQTDHLLETLACVHPCTDKPFEALHRLVTERGGSLSGCICVLLSWSADRQRFVTHLHRLGVPTVVFLIVDPSRPRSAAPDPEMHTPAWLHRLEVGKIAEALARL